jgi:hypothetical protein
MGTELVGLDDDVNDKLNAIRVELVPAPGPATSASAQANEVPISLCHGATS